MIVSRPPNGERTGLSNKWCWETMISTRERMKLALYLTPYTKLNSKWIKNLIIRPKAIKVLAENIGQKLHDIGFGNDFLDMTTKAQGTKKK